MNSKRNKVRMSGTFRPVLVLIITLATMISSCVEGDLYDLYDEINIESQINRTKITKETNNTHIVNSAGHYFEISDNVLPPTDACLKLFMSCCLSIRNKLKEL